MRRKGILNSPKGRSSLPFLSYQLRTHPERSKGRTRRPNSARCVGARCRDRRPPLFFSLGLNTKTSDIISHTGTNSRNLLTGDGDWTDLQGSSSVSEGHAGKVEGTRPELLCGKVEVFLSVEGRSAFVCLQGVPKILRLQEHGA